MKVLDHLEEWLITFLMGGATLVIFIAVLHRYASGIPLPALQDWLLTINMSWAQELCIFMFVWMCKFGAAYGVRTGIHVGVDVLVNRLPAEWRTKAVLVALVCGTLFTGIIGTLGLRFIWEDGMHYAVFHALGIDTGEMPRGPTTPRHTSCVLFTPSSFHVGTSARSPCARCGEVSASTRSLRLIAAAPATRAARRAPRRARR